MRVICAFENENVRGWVVESFPKWPGTQGCGSMHNLETLGAVSERFRVFGLFPKHPCHARLGPTTQAEGVVIENQSTPVPILGLDVEADSFPRS